MALEFNTIGVQLKWASETTSGSRPASGYVQIPDIKSTPSIDINPNKIEVKFRDEEAVTQAVRSAVEQRPRETVNFFSQNELEYQDARPTVTVVETKDFVGEEKASPKDVLKEISDYDHVAVMLSPQSMSVERFFDRDDPEKRFLLNVIESCENPEAVMENYRRGLALINSREHYDEYKNSGFFTVVRPDSDGDSREEVCDCIARHFGLI